MILNFEHDMLVSGPDQATCETHVRLFLEKSQLVHYDVIEFDPSLCINAAAPFFGERVAQGEDANRRILFRLLDKLKNEGCTELQDILSLPQGFQSKLLHTMSHLLDGFFGIDSRFYDIDEMSHWITEGRRRQITDSPETCWLIRVKARLMYEQGFEKESE
ncbi:MAG: hypothetical protein Kow0089_01710 [Desulfobulbaceae bacterium]